MTLCSLQCIPCCDFCKFVTRGSLEKDGTGGPIKCNLYDDEAHHFEVDTLGYCEDYYCRCSDKFNEKIFITMEEYSKIDL